MRTTRCTAKTAHARTNQRDCSKIWDGVQIVTSEPQHSLEGKMIFAAHVVIYSKNAEADRAFFRDVLGFTFVDAGHGWLIFALPPGEAAFHPCDENGAHELYFI